MKNIEKLKTYSLIMFFIMTLVFSANSIYLQTKYEKLKTNYVTLEEYNEAFNTACALSDALRQHVDNSPAIFDCEDQLYSWIENIDTKDYGGLTSINWTKYSKHY